MWSGRKYDKQFVKEVESNLEAVYQLKQESSQVNSSVPEDLGGPKEYA